MTQRSRNFDGCWTCRIRKIKCDNTKPTCLRCQRTGIECKGYDISLVWVEMHTVNSSNEKVAVASFRSPFESRASRRKIELAKFPQSMQYETYKKLNDTVVTLDESVAHSGPIPVFVGPFGAFPSFPTSHRSKETRRNSHLRDTVFPENSKRNGDRDNTSFLKNTQKATSTRAHPMSARPTESTHSVSRDRSARNETFDTVSTSPGASHEPEPLLARGDNSYVHHELLDSAKLAIVAIKGPRYEFSEQGMLHILYPKFFPNVESDEWEPDLKVLNMYFGASSTNEVVLSPSLRSAIPNLLKSNIAFSRVYHPRGPWNTLVVPLIKQIFYEIICEEYSSDRGWKDHLIDWRQESVSRAALLRNIRFTIFCLCISLSCGERSFEPGKGPSVAHITNQDLRSSIELRKVAINALNYHLDEYHDNSSSSAIDDYDTFLLLALLLQIQSDVTFGVFENFELMYAIGDFILKKPKTSKEKQSPVERYLRQRFNILNIFYESTQSINFFNYSIPEKDQKSKYSDLNDNYDLSKSNQKDESSEFSGTEEDSDSDEEKNPVRVNESTPLTFTVDFDGTRRRNVESFVDSESIYNQVYEIPKQELLEPTNSSSPLTISPDDKSVFVTFGIPKSLTQLFHEVIQLTNHKAVFRSKGVTPRNFPRICADTEDRLLNWNVENHWKLYDNEYNPISNVATKTFISPFHEGLFYYVRCFHHALVLYYKRLISEVPLKDVQGYIERSFSKLEKLLDLMWKSESSGNAFCFSPSFWPILVCGCDIDLRTHAHLKQKCQELWNSPCFQRHNYWRPKQILFEVWHRQAEEGNANGFMDMIREWDIVLSLG